MQVKVIFGENQKGKKNQATQQERKTNELPFWFTCCFLMDPLIELINK